MRTMLQFRRAFTLIELLVVVAIIALLISILLPSLGRAREAAKRGVCGQHIKGITGACKTYAFDNRDWWPQVTHFVGMPSANVTPYETMGGTSGLPRDEESENVNTAKGLEVSPSRALWLLVQSGQLTPKNFICPSSEDIVDETPDVTGYYDFKGYGYLSYGYQIPIYQRRNSCRPREGVDPRMVFLADKNPSWRRSDTEAVSSSSPANNEIVAFNSWRDTEHAPFTLCPDPINQTLPLDQLQPLNSENHGGEGKGEGQNIARADGSVGFEKTALVGVDGDNIYTPILRSQNWQKALFCGGPFGIPLYTVPGENAFGNEKDSSTDTALFP